MATAPADIQLSNETFVNYLSTPGQEKRALDAGSKWIRYKLREKGFMRPIMRPQNVTREDFDRQLTFEEPIVLVDKEPDSPASVTVPFGSLPMSFWLQAGKFPVAITELHTPRAQKHVNELLTYAIDLRQVISDNMLKDLLAQEDTAFIAGVNACLVGQNQVVAASGQVQWVKMYGGITRNTLEEAAKVLPRTPSRLEAATVLTNNITMREIMKMGRDETGGDMSEDVFRDGWSYKRFMNLDWVITIKHEIVPEQRIYYFADPDYLGRAYLLEDATMWAKREAAVVEWYFYEFLGATIGNSNAVAAVDFV